MSACLHIIIYIPLGFNKLDHSANQSGDLDSKIFLRHQITDALPVNIDQLPSKKWPLICFDSLHLGCILAVLRTRPGHAI